MISAEEREIFMRKPINDVRMSARAANCLKSENIVYIGDVVQKTEMELLSIPRLGRRTLKEIKEVLAEMGLHLQQSKQKR